MPLAESIALALAALPAAIVVFSLPCHALLLRMAGHAQASARKMAPHPPPAWPPLTVVLPAANEERTIARRIACLRAAYPEELLRIVVVLNNSRDSTKAVCKDLGVEMLHSAPGKMAALEMGRLSCNTDLLLITDCDVIHGEDTVKLLVAGLLQDAPQVCALSAFCAFDAPRDTRLMRSMQRHQEHYNMVCHQHGELSSALLVQGPMTLYRHRLMPPIPAGAAEDEISIAAEIVRRGLRARLLPQARVSQMLPEGVRPLLRMRTRQASRQVLSAFRALPAVAREGSPPLFRTIFFTYLFLPRCLPLVTAPLVLSLLIGLLPAWPLLAVLAGGGIVLGLCSPSALLHLVALHQGWLWLPVIAREGSAWAGYERDTSNSSESP